MRSHRRAAVTVAAVAAATVLSACGGQVSGEAAPTTSAESFTLKAATETGVAPAVSGPGPVGELQDVAGQGDLLLGRDGQQYAPSPRPGVKVSSTMGGKCTLGPAITKAGRSGFLVARHCDGDFDGQAGLQYARVNAEAKSPLLLGPIADQDWTTDAAVIWTETAADDDRVAGKWPVRGMLTVEQVRALPEDAAICFNGAMSGVRCGGKLTGGITFTTTASAQPGDSGSEAFVVDSRGGAWVVGVVTNAPAGNSLMHSIDDVLRRLNAELVTAR